MDKTVQEKFCGEFNLAEKMIKKYENYFTRVIIPVIDRRYLSHLVAAIEAMVNEKRKDDVLKRIKGLQELLDENDNDTNYANLKSSINSRVFRLFSITLAPVESGKIYARTYIIKNDYGVLITYWKGLSAEQARILVARELGHVVNKYLFGNCNSAPDSGLAALLCYIALRNRSEFYKNKTKPFTWESDMNLYDDIAKICGRRDA